MGRVEETNAALTELEKTMVKTLDDTTSKEIAVAVTITGVSSVNVEIAKSLAQLADDIHFLREILAKEMENDEVPTARRRQAGAKCMDCRYCDFVRVDKNGETRLNVEWCHRKGAEIDMEDRPVCGYFEYRGKEAES